MTLLPEEMKCFVTCTQISHAKKVVICFF